MTQSSSGASPSQRDATGTPGGLTNSLGQNSHRSAPNAPKPTPGKGFWTQRPAPTMASRSSARPRRPPYPLGQQALLHTTRAAPRGSAANHTSIMNDLQDAGDSTKHARQPLPDVRQAPPDVTHSLPDVMQRKPDTRERLPDIGRTLLDVRQTSPDIRRGLHGLEQQLQDVVEQLADVERRLPDTVTGDLQATRPCRLRPRQAPSWPYSRRLMNSTSWRGDTTDHGAQGCPSA